MKRLSVLIKPASALCNMRCKYCFYFDVAANREIESYGLMKEETMEKLIDHVYLDLEDGDVMTFSFQGGEPTLAGLSFFEKFTAYVSGKSKKVTVHYTIQTNGTMIDKSWCEFLKDHQFLVGLSIDGDKALHDENRLSHIKKGTFNRVMKTKQMFDDHAIEYNVLCVLTNKLARYPQRIFNFLLAEKIKYVQFIPCLDELESSDVSPFALKPDRFASFYNTLFPLWFKEFMNGNYISIKLFDDVVYLLRTGRPSACGMLGNCQPQFVIEADGSTYPCDFYVLDEYKMGNITEQTMLEMLHSENLKKFQCSNHAKRPDYCQKCPFYNMCYSGCKRMRNSMYLNVEESYCGYQEFLTKNIKQLQHLAMKVPK